MARKKILAAAFFHRSLGKQNVVVWREKMLSSAAGTDVMNFKNIRRKIGVFDSNKR
jgi:hypothetical protein